MSINEERLLWAARLDAYRKALGQIVDLVDSAQEVSADQLLQEIGNVAERALRL